ncbi:MAG: S-layer homology domain-containing protein [Leptolyngbya sp.]|nr:S-layer homology domain-containing protein [Candidatus Melainabacteria bacterium]
MRLPKSLIATAIVGYLLSASPAYSADIGQVLQQFSSSVKSWNELESRLSELSNQLNLAQQNGSLTRNQVLDFRAQIDKIGQEEAAAKASGARMSFVDMFKYTNRLNLLATQVNQTMQDRHTTAVDVVGYQAQLKRQIADARAANQLTQVDSDKLNQDLRVISDMESGFKTTGDGNLTPKQNDLLVDKLDVVKAAIAQQIAQSQSAIPEITARREALKKKIIDNASLFTVEQGTSLNSELAQIESTQSNFASSGNISGSQIYSLATSLDKLDRRIDELMNGRTANAGYPRGGRDYGPRDGYPGSGPRGDYPRGDGPRGDYPRGDGSPPWRDRDGNMSNNDGPRGDRGPRGGADWQNNNNPNYNNSDSDIATAPPRRGRGRRNADGTRGDASNNANDSDDQAPLNTSSTPSANETASGGSSGGGYRDVQGYWGETYVSNLASRGILGGFPDGTFKPNDQITRAQFAAIATKALSVPTSGAAASFRDVPAKHWANNVIAAVSTAGLVTGFPDGTFRPEDKITRAQALIILAKALKGVNPDAADLNAYSDAADVPAWAQKSVSTAAAGHIIVNFPEASMIRPNELATRGEVAGLVYQTLLQTGKDLPKVSIGVLKTRSNLR